MDEEQDINPTPEDGIPNQDIVPDPDKGQTPSNSQDLELPENGDDVLAELDDATLSLEESEPDDSPPAEAPSIPVDEPEPTSTATAPAPVDVADLAIAETPSTPDLGELDSATLSLESPTEDLDSATASIESFGQQLHDFQEAGGADNGVPNLDDNSGDEQHDATEQLNDADFGFKSRASDMLIEQARRIDELTRGLEAERL